MWINLKNRWKIYTYCELRLHFLFYFKRGYNFLIRSPNEEKTLMQYYHDFTKLSEQIRIIELLVGASS